MFTRCPACHTLFRIQPKQLKAARGQVRCGSCQAVFDGLECLVNREELSKEELAAFTKSKEAASRQWQLPFDDDAPPAEQQPAAQVGTTVEEPAPAEPAESKEGLVAEEEKPSTAREEGQRAEAVEQPADASAEVETEEAEPARTAEASGTVVPAVAPVAPPVESEPLPTDKPPQSFRWSPRYVLSGHEPETVPPRLGWAFGSLLLLTVLAGQLAWFNRDTLALDPRWRPWLQQVCDTAGCTLPPLRDPHAIEMVDRNVQSHPQYQGALLITATLVNQASFAQPYPEVELSMTDLDQKRVAVRRFLPAEYLDNGKARGLIPSGASVRLKLEIADPGQEAVGFEFDFY
jgi:predicted Zn finger-like uncharacterized protein